MDYEIQLQNLAFSEQDREMLNTRISLGLSRFANLISTFDIHLSKKMNTKTGAPVTCNIIVNLRAGHKVEVSDSDNNVNAVLDVAIQRVKRAIERHLKHHRGPRLGSSMTSRT